MADVTQLRPSVAATARPIGCDAPVADTELADVLAEIIRVMAAQAAILSAHPGGGAAPQLISACIPHDIVVDPLALIADRGLSSLAGVTTGLAWGRHVDGVRSIDVLMLPVTAIDGHNQLFVSVLFRRPSAQQRATAEQLFELRQPIAMGYFRLWQLERVRARRLAALEAACDVTDLGILLFTRAGQLDFVNAAASELLAIGDGLRRHRRSVQASDISDSVKLQVALNHATAANEAGDGRPSARRRAPLVRLHRASGEPLIAVVVAAELPAVEPGDIAVMVYLFDPALDLDRLLKPVCSAFKLSPVETQLACQLAAGHSIGEAATTLRIKLQTARGYLKNIFVKTDTRRQAELVHLMLSNVFRVGRTIQPEVL